MKVTMKSQISGTRDGKDWPAPGESIDLPDEEARALVASGSAVEGNDPDAEALESRRMDNGGIRPVGAVPDDDEGSPAVGTTGGANDPSSDTDEERATREAEKADQPAPEKATAKKTADAKAPTAQNRKA